MPVITKIIAQKRRPNRRNVYLDGTFAFGANLNVIARFRLREGLTLSDEQVQAIVQGEVRQECFDKALAYLQLRLHSRAELTKKLIGREYSPAMAADVVEQLRGLGYVDDERFARTKAASAAQHKHHGQKRARLELLKAGIGGAVADRALAEVYTKAGSAAVADLLAEKQLPRLRKLEPAVARRRLAGMLQRRGFDYETIAPIIEKCLGADRQDELNETQASIQRRSTRQESSHRLGRGGGLV